jgi:hypothetical protein
MSDEAKLVERPSLAYMATAILSGIHISSLEDGCNCVNGKPGPTKVQRWTSQVSERLTLPLPTQPNRKSEQAQQLLEAPAPVPLSGQCPHPINREAERFTFRPVLLILCHSFHLSMQFSLHPRSARDIS